jgi:hypothetical protein
MPVVCLCVVNIGRSNFCYLLFLKILIFFLQLKLQLPLCEVVIVERRAEYKRVHAIKIEQYAFERMYTDHAGLVELARSFPPRTRTNIVEEKLRQLALDSGVVLRCPESYPDLPTLLAAIPGVDVVLCADGAGSLSRKELAGAVPEMAMQEQLGALLQVKFDAKGVVESKSSIWQTFLQNINLQQQVLSWRYFKMCMFFGFIFPIAGEQMLFVALFVQFFKVLPGRMLA